MKRGNLNSYLTHVNGEDDSHSVQSPKSTGHPLDQYVERMKLTRALETEAALTCTHRTNVEFSQSCVEARDKAFDIDSELKISDLKDRYTGGKQTVGSLLST